MPSTQALLYRTFTRTDWQKTSLEPRCIMCQTVTELIRFKWQVLLDRVQERISESNAPLSGDLAEIEKVI